MVCPLCRQEEESSWLFSQKKEDSDLEDDYYDDYYDDEIDGEQYSDEENGEYWCDCVDCDTSCPCWCHLPVPVLWTLRPVVQLYR